MKRETRSRRRPDKGLRRLRTNVAGIDLGASEHWVCGPAEEDGERNVATFGTTTPELERLAKWLIEQGVESVAMESTGIYWIPVYELLEHHGIEVVLVNARHLSSVPGRKSVLGSSWSSWR